MSRPRTTLIHLLPLLLLPVLSSCESETTVPNSHAWNLVGRVTDTGGNALAGAFVNIGYTVLADGDTTWVPESGPASFTTVVPDSFSLEIHDHLGHLVWDLRGGPDDFPSSWPGTDLSGRPVPDGPYRLTLTSFFPDSTGTSETWTVVAADTVEARALKADVETDSQGTFTIPVETLPVWDSYSNPAVTYSFGTEIVLYAFRGDGSAQFARAAVDVSTQAPDSLLLEIPD